MATDLEQLVLSISADNRQMLRVLKKLEGDTNSTTRKVEKHFDRMGKKIDARLSGIGKNAFRGLLGGAAAAFGARELIRLTDTWTDLNSRVALAAGGMEHGAEVMGRLGEVARRTYSSLEQTAEGYLLNATAMRELGYSTDQTLDYTEAVNNALVISGAKGQRAEAVTNALSKAMAGGVLKGVNLNTVIEQGGRLAEALADGLGVGVNQLRALGAQGKITGRDIVSALSKQMEKLRQEAEQMPATIGDGFQLLQNALLQYVGNADSAAGISAKISEALVIMADNFDTVADAGLRLAAIFAAGMLGRSVAGMAKTLGLGSVALANFTKAIAAARTMGGLQVAFGGLAAAAGPAGMVIGAGLATALVVAEAKAAATESRIERLNAEMERLGIRGKAAKDGVNEAADAIDNLVDETTAQKLRDVNDELDRLRGGGGLFAKGDEFGSIAKKASQLQGTIGNLANQAFGDGSENRALNRIIKIAQEIQRTGVLTREMRDTVAEIAQQDLSKPTLELNRELAKSAQWFRDVVTEGAALGDTSAVDAAIERVGVYKMELADMASIDLISEDQKRQMTEIIEKFAETGEGAEETKDALRAVADVNPNAIDYVNRLGPILDGLALVKRAAQETAAALERVNPSGTGADPKWRRAEDASMDIYREMKAANDAYISDATRRAKLGKDQLALENEIARVRKDSLSTGAMLSEDQLKRIAEANLAGNAARGAEGKKAKAPKKTGDDRFENLTQDVYDRIEAMRLEAETIGLTYREQQKRRMALDLEQEALKFVREEARKKGDQDWQNARLTPEQIAKIDEASDAYARQADALREIEEAQSRAESAAAEFYDTFKSGMVGAIKGAESFSDALSRVLEKLADMALNSAFDALFKGATSSGGWLTGIFKGIGFSSGTANTGGRRGEPRGIVHGQEAVIPLPSGGKVPVQIQAPPMPSVARSSGGTETVRIVLQDDSGRMADIADQRIRTASGTIVQVSVQQSTRAVRQQMSGMIADTQTRSM